MKFNNSIILITCFSIILSGNTFAARFGSGKSYGTARSSSNYSSYNSYNSARQNNAATQTSYAQQQQQATSTMQQNRPGIGAGTAALMGAAAGAAGGYMLGRSATGNNSINDQNASGTTQAVEPQSATAGIPWGTIAILAFLLFVGLILFRKGKTTNPRFSGTVANPLHTDDSNFSIPNLKRRMNFKQSLQQRKRPAYNVAAQPLHNDDLTKLPDGIETMYFLRQAKGIFLHIQSMNNLENVTEISKYMTDNLYKEMKDVIANNKFIADFTQLDCELLNCETNDNQLIASVRFFGMVSEEPQQQPQPFSEIWNFIKTDINHGKWLIAGIQQETLNT
ncbi:MAG: hypothetical protein QG673_1392 [Pseudomonadota bacterium]|nr:hypothetical protein [Pseudomonadota bacterium]